MKKNSIFLTGWEYNRLLYNDPLVSRNSGLPAETLWMGCAQFWLFENVYVTKDAFDIECAAADHLNWTTAKIFRELEEKKYIKVIDIQKEADASPLLKQRLLESHRRIRQRLSPEHIEALVRSRSWYELELLKLEFLEPLLSHLNCVRNISPSSLPVWGPERGFVQKDAFQNPILNAIAAKVRPWKIGSSLCSPPGTGVDKNDVAKQREIERTVQGPIISDLLMSKLKNEDYIYALSPTIDVYKPINKQLAQDFASNISNLEYLRDEAQRTLWTDLHGEWLNQLELNSDYYSKFEFNLDRALRGGFSRAEQYTYTAISALASTAGAAAGAIAGAHIASTLGANPAEGGIFGAAAGGGLSRMFDKITKDEFDRKTTRTSNASKNLTLFFQKLKDVDMLQK